MAGRTRENARAVFAGWAAKNIASRYLGFRTVHDRENPEWKSFRANRMWQSLVYRICLWNLLQRAR
jgi:hypothetical protein